MDYRVAIIGASGHSYHAMQDICNNEGLHMCAFASGREDEDISPLLHCELFGAQNIPTYTDFIAMLDTEAPDIAVVNPFYFLQADITVECLKRGVSVLSEKPLALDRESLQQVIVAHKNSTAKLSSILEFRCDPRFYTAKSVVEQGLIGEPVMGYSQKSYKLGERPWFYKSRTTFGGLIPWVGIHAIDWFRYVTGLDYLGVFASHNNHKADHYPEMEDSAACLFELSNGGRVVMSYDYLRPSGADTHADDRLRLVGTEGVLEISTSNGLSVIDKTGTVYVKQKSPGYGMLYDLAKSMHCSDYVPLITAEDAIYATEVSLIARDSADEMIHLNIVRGDY